MNVPFNIIYNIKYNVLFCAIRMRASMAPSKTVDRVVLVPCPCSQMVLVECGSVSRFTHDGCSTVRVLSQTSVLSLCKSTAERRSAIRSTFTCRVLSPFHIVSRVVRARTIVFKARTISTRVCNALRFSCVFQFFVANAKNSSRFDRQSSRNCWLECR